LGLHVVRIINFTITYPLELVNVPRASNDTLARIGKPLVRAEVRIEVAALTRLASLGSREAPATCAALARLRFEEDVDQMWP